MNKTKPDYNQILKKTRGWISKWPRKIVFIFSGGMDSTITIARLLTDQNIEIYPLFINRGQTNYKFEKKAVKFFNAYFRKKFPKLYHDVFEIAINVPAKEIKHELKNYTEKHGHPLRNTMLQMIGVQYAISLSSPRSRITSVFCAQVPDDPFPHSTLSSLRSNTLNVCEGLGEWDWQITSPNIDPILSKRPAGKIEMIRWASKIGLPLEKTRSCYTDKELHCGACLTCRRRKEAFAKAGTIDKTKYEN